MIRLLLILAALFAWIAWHNRRPVTWTSSAYNTPTYAGGSW